MIYGYARAAGDNYAESIERQRTQLIKADVLKNFLQKQKDGELTVNECCRSLGISRSKWYNSIREVS